MTKEGSFNDLKVEMDSLQALYGLKSQAIDMSFLGLLLDDIKAFNKSLGGINFGHVS